MACLAGGLKFLHCVTLGSVIGSVLKRTCFSELTLTNGEGFVTYCGFDLVDVGSMLVSPGSAPRDVSRSILIVL